MTVTSKECVAAESLREYLSRFRGARVYHPPLVDTAGNLVGNNGDRLMVMGTDRVYAEFGINRVNEPAGADLVVLGASGGMLDKFTHIPRLFSRLSQAHPDTPMCVLPSTFFYESRQLAEDIGARRAPLDLFCRERRSYDHLRTQHKLPEMCRLHLDHDLAFELASSEYVASVRAMEPRHVLIVERVDVEHASVALSAASTSMRLRKLVGRSMSPEIKKRLYPAVRFFRSKRSTPFRATCKRLLRKGHPDLADLPRLVADVSNVNTCSFDEFTRAVGEAAVVFTTRLHVAILAAMAGKPTYVFEGPYHKIRGIYEHSLEGRANVWFVPLDAVHA